jgi:hypothetical protein
MKWLLLRLIKTRAKRSWESRRLWSRWIVHIRERRAGSGGETKKIRREEETRESPLVVKRADRNPDTFVGLARTYARLDKQDRYDRYSRRDTRWPASDWWISLCRRFRSRTFSRARAIVQPRHRVIATREREITQGNRESAAASSHARNGFNCLIFGD